MANEYQFKIGAVAKLTGLSSHNIRAWENRYRAVVAHRLESGRRFYTQQQVDRLVNLKKCISLGEAISNIAHLDDETLQQKIVDLNAQSVSDNPAQSILTVGVIGPESFQAKIVEREHLSVRYRLDFAEFSPLELGAIHAVDPVCVLFVYCASISDSRAMQIKTLSKSARAEKIILYYRFANQKNLHLLNQAGVQVVKGPVDDTAIQIMVSSLMSAQASQPAVELESIFAYYPTHIFSDEQLSTLVDLPSKIDCECPHHLAELLEGLKAFERYSGECMNKNDDDAALHSKIQRTTAGVRHRLELLLQDVLAAEGLTL